MENWLFEKLLKKIYDIDSDIKHFMFTTQVMKLMITG